jgi:hypothetical protein
MGVMFGESRQACWDGRCAWRRPVIAADRVSEVCALTLKKVQAHEEQTRHIFMTGSVYQELVSLRCDAGDDDPVFLSLKDSNLQRA